jgi:FtsH-binding integral membrane protein
MFTFFIGSCISLFLQLGRVLEHSNGSVIFVFLLVFIIATITQCFMFSVFFSKANLAAVCAGILFFIGYIPYMFCTQWEEFMRTWQKALAVSLFPE